MCQQKTTYSCKHSGYRKIICSAKQTQRSSCFFFMLPPQCINGMISQFSTQPCPTCLRKDREIWAQQVADRKREEEEASRYPVSMQDFDLTAIQKPQPVRLRLEPEQLDTDGEMATQSPCPIGRRKSTSHPSVPPGIDLSSLAGDAFRSSRKLLVQQQLPNTTRSERPNPDSSKKNGSSHRQQSPPPLRRPVTSRYIDTTHYPHGDRRVSGVPSGYADVHFVSPQTSVEDRRAEAQRRVVDGLGNMF